MRTHLPWIVFVFGLEAISALTIFHPHFQTVVLIVLAVLMFVLAWRRPTMAAAVLLSEYMIGSKGGILRAFGDGLGHGGISLRIAWFVAFFLGWLAWSIQHRTYREWKGYLRGRSVYVILGAVLVYAFLRGSALHNVFVFDDANAWGVWLLLLPALDVARHKSEELQRFLPPALMTAFVWLCTKTLILFYLFSHLTNQVWLEAIYVWVRRTGVGEITRAVAGANAWRVFFQSHVYVLPVIVGCFWYGAFHKKASRSMWTLWVFAFSTLVVSLSRSLFIGVAAGFVASVVCMVVGAKLSRPGSVDRSEGERTSPLRVIGRLVIGLVVSLLVVAVLFYAPPHSSGSLMNLLAARTNVGDEATVSRWTLLPALMKGIMRHPVLGSGFGATITYRSSDPTVVAQTGGVYTTYAFEWGWLEHWLKFGLIGIPLVLWIIGRLILLSWTSSYEFWVRGALVCGLVGLAVTHLFTPYLNHPLGIVWLIFVEAALFRLSSVDKES